MRRIPRSLVALLALLALTLVLAACGGDDSSSSDSSSSSSSSGGGNKPGTLIKKDSVNSSKQITIGSKNFPEQYILGEIYSQALAAAGFKVKKSLDLGAEQVAFKALKGGKVDAYPEYTGTA